MDMAKAWMTAIKMYTTSIFISQLIVEEQKVE